MNKRERLLDYLYGEMSTTERDDFEKELAADPSLRTELDTLRQTRGWLSELSDIRPETAVVTLSPPPVSWRKWGLRSAAAAGILLLLFLFNARLQWNEYGLTFSLGQPELSPAPVVEKIPDEDHFRQLLQQQEDNLHQQLQAMDTRWRQHLLQQEAQVRADWETRLTQWREKESEELGRLARQLQTDNLTELAGLMQSVQLKQKREMRALLNELWGQWQQTRADDLRSIESEFVNLYQNTERNQLETEALLKTILNGSNL
jgi:hypothetical protein